ncbi:hypothetical protein PR048_025308 [Dryococelus australis]|uniref:Uncharacterized protein n=1 Tax=Dryococelus australis TaxID=614101 RepID=A0ABQ9GR02_9NEOP|nr:hypothetical protein PR048_025308 [Dryococelus australis]
MVTHPHEHSWAYPRASFPYYFGFLFRMARSGIMLSEFYAVCSPHTDYLTPWLAAVAMHSILHSYKSLLRIMAFD